MAKSNSTAPFMKNTSSGNPYVAVKQDLITRVVNLHFDEMDGLDYRYAHKVLKFIWKSLPPAQRQKLIAKFTEAQS